MERTIRVTGRGNVSLKPDTTVITLDFSRIRPTYEETVKASCEDVKIMKETLVSLGFKASDLKTIYFNVNSAFDSVEDENGKHKSVFIGYKYNQTLKFSFPVDNALLGKVLYKLANLKGCYPKFYISYTVKDTEGAKNLLLEDAIKDATKKATIIASASNVKLGDLLNVDYSFINVEFNTRSYDTLRMCNKSDMLSESYDIDIEPDDIDVTDTVTMVYEIK